MQEDGDMKKVSIIAFLVLLSVTSASLVFAQEPDTTAPASSEKTVTLTAKEVKAVQQALFNRGYLTKEPSGVLDAESRRAIRDFQKAQNLEETGKIDTATLEKLGLTIPIDSPPVDSERKRGLLSKIGYGIKDTASATGKAVGSTATTVTTGTKKGTEKVIDSTSDAIGKGGDTITSAGDKSVEGAKDVKNKAGELTDKVGTAVIGRSDAEIQKDVRKVLNGRDSTRYLQSDVKEGRVTLVSDNSENEDISSAVSEVRRISGVKAVMVVQK